LLFTREGHQLVDCRLAVSDYSGAGGEDRNHAAAVTSLLTRPAKVGMEDRDEVVDEVDGPYAGALDPIAEAVAIKPRMSGVEAEPAPALATAAPPVPDGKPNEPAAKVEKRAPQKTEQGA
jgi:hypothetical protein